MKANGSKMAVLLTSALWLGSACGSSSKDGPSASDDAGSGDLDGGGDSSIGDASLDGAADASTDEDSGIIDLMDGAIPDSGVEGCALKPCQGKVYRCGNCLDDDGDGLVDDHDPDCLGPCDNNETGYSLGIPGGNNAPCKLDCYFDQDTGSGNDACSWDHRCDELMPQGDRCPYSSSTVGSRSCPDVQTDTCGEFCGPLTPNGCDCFGCCNLPSGTDRWVFIGSTSGGTPSCSLDDVADDTKCKPCTPVAACLNTCERCELCLGKDTLPADCLETPDGGTDPGPRCPSNQQACGLPGDPPCPNNGFCLTGCCLVVI